MSRKPSHNVSAKTGSFQDPQSGQSRNRYQKIGVAFTNDDGSISMKIDALPLPHTEFDGTVVLFPADNANQQPQPQGAQPGYQQPAPGYQQPAPQQPQGYQQPAPQQPGQPVQQPSGFAPAQG